MDDSFTESIRGAGPKGKEGGGGLLQRCHVFFFFAFSSCACSAVSRSLTAHSDRASLWGEGRRAVGVYSSPCMAVANPQKPTQPKTEPSRPNIRSKSNQSNAKLNQPKLIQRTKAGRPRSLLVNLEYYYCKVEVVGLNLPIRFFFLSMVTTNCRERLYIVAWVEAQLL